MDRLNWNFQTEFGRKRSTSLGKEFTTVFLQNKNSKEVSQREILITGISPSTSVSITISKSGFRKDVTVGIGETVTVPIMDLEEVRGSETSLNSLVITSDADITVMTRNYKENSGDMALIYPTYQWGVEYYIITPSHGPNNEYNQFSVVSHKNPTTVNIYVEGAVMLNGKNYRRGEMITLNLEPFQAVQIQSKDDLSGTKVVSQYPVAVLAGHTCAQNSEGCGHVYEQLLPISSWGNSFFIPGMSFQSNYDTVYVLSSKDSCICYWTGNERRKMNIQAGQLIHFPLDASSPLSLHCTDRVQVLMYGNGGIINNKAFGSFLTKIPHINSFGLGYNLIGQNKFDHNLAIIVAKTSSASGITINGNVPKDIKWNEFPESEYSYAEYNYGCGFSSNLVEHSTVPFGLLTLGYSLNTAYGTVAPCIKDYVPSLPLDGIETRIGGMSFPEFRHHQEWIRDLVNLPGQAAIPIQRGISLSGHKHTDPGFGGMSSQVEKRKTRSEHSK